MGSNPRRIRRLTKFKIIAGTLLALVALSSGEHFCLGDGFFGLFRYCPYERGYFLTPGLFEVSVTVLAIILLLSAFRDIYAILGPIKLLERNAESIADRPGDE